MDPYDEFFARYSPNMQAISRNLRAMVKGAMPEANEVLVDRHNHIAYDYGASPASRVVYICPMTDYVRLGFMYGTYLADPEQLLIGEGRRLRHVKIRSLEEAGRPALKSLVVAAGAEAQVRLAQRPAKRKQAGSRHAAQ